MSNKQSPIIKSILDQDAYKFFMGQLVFTDFPEAVVDYEFFNRGKTPFPEKFAEEVNWQIELMGALRMNHREALFLSTLPGIKTPYVEYMRKYEYDPGEVYVAQEGDKLRISVRGRWYRTIYWEVPLMAIVSELYFALTGCAPDMEYQQRICKKAGKMSGAYCKWADFGTRRRFSYEVQNNVVRLMKSFTGFIGTSNVYLAMEHNVPSIGTSAHEMVMGLSALYGPQLANKMWAEHWSKMYRGLNGIALTDTFTTDVFLRDWDGYWVRLFDGVRQDSGDPNIWMAKMLSHYQALGIDTRSKKFVFSDGLNEDTFIKISQCYSNVGQIVGGIGTNLTNDCGKHIVPLNIVIKMVSADFGRGPQKVVKLSDNSGKHTGCPDTIKRVKEELGI